MAHNRRAEVRGTTDSMGNESQRTVLQGYRKDRPAWTRRTLLGVPRLPLLALFAALLALSIWLHYRGGNAAPTLLQDRPLALLGAEETPLFYHVAPPARTPLHVPRKRVSVYCMGHKQGSMLFMGLLRGLGSQRELRLCRAPSDERFPPWHETLGMWRWSIGGMGRWVCGEHQRCKKMSSRQCAEFGSSAMTWRDVMNPALIMASDLTGSDLAALANRSRLGIEVSVVRAVRDPRDVVLSGYRHHRRGGGEPWMHRTGSEWLALRARAPQGSDGDATRFLGATLLGNESYTQRLQGVSEHDGLLLEIQLAARAWLGSLLSFAEEAARPAGRNKKGGGVTVEFSSYEAMWASPEAELGRVAEQLFDGRDEFAGWFAEEGAKHTRSEWAKAGIHQNEEEESAGKRAVRGSKRGSSAALNKHTRSGGKPGKWRNHLGEAHHAAIRREGIEKLLPLLGYNASDY